MKTFIQKFEEDFNNCTIRYGDMKKQLAEDMVAFYCAHPRKSQCHSG